MSEREHPPDDAEPDESAENPLEPTPDFGEHEEVAQEQEWVEDAREGGD